MSEDVVVVLNAHGHGAYVRRLKAGHGRDSKHDAPQARGEGLLSRRRWSNGRCATMKASGLPKW
eukprot:2010468-Alexandrium_andersonii.AAC.1